MAHTKKNKDKILARISRIQGQLNGVVNALESDAECYRVMQTLASAQGAIKGLMADLLEDHMKEHVVAAKRTKDAAIAGQEAIDVMKSFWK